MGPSPVLVLQAAERNQNANYEVQAYERSKFASYCLEESKRRPGKPEPPIEAVRINAPLGAGELEARATMLAREIDRCREQLLTKTMSRHMRCKKRCPLYPQKQMCAVQTLMSALGQKRTSPHLSLRRRGRAKMAARGRAPWRS